jgi:hypothetical protein
MYRRQFSPHLNLLKIRTSWLIFFACVWIYAFSDVPLGGRVLASPDSTANSLLAFNWLFNGHLDFDNFRQGAYYDQGYPPFFMIESPSGHLASTYPVGVALVSFPIYYGFYLFLRLSHQSIDITSASFFVDRLFFERLAASLIASLSVVLFYQLSRIQFSQSIALFSSFCYGFATTMWAIGSQGLWQHGSTNLVLLAVMLCFAKANRNEPRLLLVNAGILSGFLYGIRPTNLVFLLVIVIYAIAIYRRQAVFLFLGLSSLLISLGWNFYFFKNLTGGYSTFRDTYWFSLEQFTTTFAGLLLSPSRGLLIYSPILLLAIPGLVQIFRRWKQKDEKLLILLFLGCVVLFFQYCFFRIWWAGICYGPRFLTDTLPILGLSLNYAIAYSQKPRDWLVSGLLIFSVSIQVIGVYGANFWEFIPTIPGYDTSIPDFSPEVKPKYWQVRDGQIERSARTVLFRITHPTMRSNYAAGFAGKVLQLRDENKQPFSAGVITRSPETKLQVYATVENTGTSQWFGYQTGADNLGEARVMVRILDASGQPVKQQENFFVVGRVRHRLFISGQPKSGERAIALRDIVLPRIPGQYTLKFAVIAEGVTNFSMSDQGDASIVVNIK